MLNLVKKSAKWTKCFFAIRSFPRQASVDELVDFCMSQPIAPLQIRSELMVWANEVALLKPRAAMEIGTFLGGTLFLLCRLASPEAKIISVDQYRGRIGGARKLIYRSFLINRQRLGVIEADSHIVETLSRVSHQLAGSELDFLFIDGDHSYEGVKQDFEMYSPLVRPGGVIAFHDIVPHPPEAQCHVHEFWSEVKQRYRHKEIVDRPNQQWAGIGVLYV